MGCSVPYNQYERENNRQKSLAGIELAKQQGKHLGRPAGRDAGKLVKVAKALEKGLSVAEIITLSRHQPLQRQTLLKHLQAAHT